MLMNILTGAVSMGEVFCLLLGDALINRLGWSWHTFVLVFSLILFCSTLAFDVGLEELPLETVEESTFCSNLSKQFSNIKEIVSKPNIFFVVLELSLNSNLFYNMVIWYPYFFTVIGFASYAAYLSIIPSLFYFLIPFVFEPLLSRC